jgi:hypothetical protein
LHCPGLVCRCLAPSQTAVWLSPSPSRHCGVERAGLPAVASAEEGERSAPYTHLWVSIPAARIKRRFCSGGRPACRSWRHLAARSSVRISAGLANTAEPVGCTTKAGCARPRAQQLEAEWGGWNFLIIRGWRTFPCPRRARPGPGPVYCAFRVASGGGRIKVVGFK